MAELKAEIKARVIEEGLIGRIRAQNGFQNMKVQVALQRERLLLNPQQDPSDVLNRIATERSSVLANSIREFYKPKRSISIAKNGSVEFVHEEQRLLLTCRYPETLIIQACKREKKIEEARTAMLGVSGTTLSEQRALIEEYGYKIVLAQHTPEEWALPVLVESVKKEKIYAPHPFDKDKWILILIHYYGSSGSSLINIIDISGPNREVRVTLQNLTSYSKIIKELEKGKTV